MRLHRIFLNIIIINCFMACQGQDSVAISNMPTMRILFVGNSLTYTNDLPELLNQEARKSGVEVHTEMMALPNYALEDHWQDGTMQKRISSGTFNFVIVQQGPSSQSDGREMLLDYGARIKTLCDQYDSKLVFFMVWPARANWHTFPGVINNYTEAATATQSILCPVGLEWKQYMESSADYSYYGPDQFHPSVKGSQNAAALIFKVLLENP
ncbi:MAG: SGNH/GDSL hydrolase family protein [Cyclobacteriaceae bacterium]|nr:SGNH/GDSL hydrolase family protein [Flammeovirgaceae bacterium]